MHACTTLLLDLVGGDRPWGKSDRSNPQIVFFSLAVGTSFDVHLGVWAFQFLYIWKTCKRLCYYIIVDSCSWPEFVHLRIIHLKSAAPILNL